MYDDDGYIVDWVDISVNNMFGDADGESGDAYAYTGYDSDNDTQLGGLDVEDFTTAADWLWGYEEDGSFDNFDDGIAFRLNLNDLLLNPVDKFLHQEFEPTNHFYAYPLRYNGDTVLVNSVGDLLNIDTGELALNEDRIVGDNLHSDVFCNTSDGGTTMATMDGTYPTPSLLLMMGTRGWCGTPRPLVTMRRTRHPQKYWTTVTTP